MNILECIWMALTSLSENKVRSFLTTLGVIIGVMSVILLVSLGEAAQAYIENQFSGMGSNVIIITPGKQETTSSMIAVSAGSFRKLTTDNVAELRRKARGIKAVTGNVIGTGQVRYRNVERNCIVLGTEEGMAVIRDVHTTQGRFISTQDVEKNNRVCVIGVKLKNDLFGSGQAMFQRISINRSKHVVVGVLEERGQMLGIDLDDLVVIPLPSGQQMFYGGEDTVFEINAAARTAEDIPMAQESIRKVLMAAHDNNEDFTIINQDAIVDSFGKILSALRLMLVGIAAISLLVGGIGIMNIMLVSVRERTREVGIRKSVGATRSDIAIQFLIEAVTLSVCGGLIGVGIAWATTVILGMIYPTVPVIISMWSVLTAFIFSLVTGVFFGVYPATKASSVDPVEALRYE
ncbi:MAG: FtsX-like permease family protein [Candidatus Hydrogenedens sp.]|jgi:putative ABC transport system permease protein|nr:FtsX-like permease family protein [Candidatus Hydrogenedens sp.]